MSASCAARTAALQADERWRPGHPGTDDSCGLEQKNSRRSKNNMRALRDRAPSRAEAGKQIADEKNRSRRADDGQCVHARSSARADPAQCRLPLPVRACARSPPGRPPNVPAASSGCSHDHRRRHGQQRFQHQRHVLITHRAEHHRQRFGEFPLQVRASAHAPAGLCAASSSTRWPPGSSIICRRPGQRTSRMPAIIAAAVTGNCRSSSSSRRTATSGVRHLMVSSKAERNPAVVAAGVANRIDVRPSSLVDSIRTPASASTNSAPAELAHRLR